MSGSDASFETDFKAMTGNEPFPWQRELFARLVSGRFPGSCRIPTGLGKTAIIPIWLIALAKSSGGREESNDIPRRLVYIVNRRTVVDQATDEAVKIRERVQGDDALSDLRSRLRSLCRDKVDVPLAISTLRGQFADNREWSADPSRPAVILGTVDMIGSRLLFSGYGIGFKTRPLHAGFLGQDTLLVHDEAHLEPAFQQLLVQIKREQQRCKEFRAFHVIELTATSRRNDDRGCLPEAQQDSDPVVITEEDLLDPEIKKRVSARKALTLHPEADEKKLVDRLFDLAIGHKDSGRAVLVFARAVETVEKIADRLRKAKQPVDTLTGTMRGQERDDLVRKPVFQRFLPNAHEANETVYLVCTSAGEVGVNISADHLVCDLSTFESMAQRFGRVNRFGTRHDARIDVVHSTRFDEGDEFQSRLKKTLELLAKLGDDASPEALDRLDPDERLAAFSPQPVCLGVSDILFDSWALTSVTGNLPGRPPVEPYLHGISAYEPPDTHVAWREEVRIIVGPLNELYKPAELLADYPIKPHEVLCDRSDRVFKRIVTLSTAQPELPVWLVDYAGTVEVLTLGELAEKANRERIDHRTVLLPPRAGGLRDGLLTGDPRDAANDVADTLPVAEGQPGRLPPRIRIWDRDAPPGMRLIRVIDTRPDADEEAEGEDESPRPRYWSWYAKPRSADDDGSKTAIGAVTWDVHTRDVVDNTAEILKKLPLPANEKKAVALAAEFHDLGKKRIVWQRSIGNPNPTNWLAKSGGKMKPVALTDYRHEFGSLLDALDEPKFRELNEDLKDLVLHLIAAHHGFGRPHFPSEVAYDLEPKGRDVGSIGSDVPTRFARLQRKYGRWGLAYLESLLRAADYAASASPSETETSVQ
jgi:CRISPR-associated endonuclease/helicase Cas3